MQALMMLAKYFKLTIMVGYCS